MGQRQGLHLCWSTDTAWAASCAELVNEDGPSCCVDYQRSRRGDKGWSRRRVRECASACSSITAQPKTKTDHITLGEPEECGTTLRKTSGKLFVRTNCALGCLSTKPSRNLTYWSHMLTKLLLVLQQNYTRIGCCALRTINQMTVSWQRTNRLRTDYCRCCVAT